MLGLAIGLLLAGTYFLLSTRSHALSEDDVRDSDGREADLKRELGVLANGSNQMEWVYRTTYRHPILMRMPGVTLLLVGTGLLVVAL